MTTGLFVSIVLYVLAALLDMVLTLAGMENNTAMEGNALLRQTMNLMGPVAALLLHKSVVGLVAVAIAWRVYPAIVNDEPWIEKVPATPWVRAWVKRCRPAWIAFIPLWLATLAQVVAASGWVWLIAVGK